LVSTVDSSLTRESDATYDCTIAVSGNNVLVRVTGIAAHNVNWRCRYTVVGVT
jgi:hypothetical protein